MKPVLVPVLAAFLFLPFHSGAKPPMLGGETTTVIPRNQAGSRGAFAFPAANLSLTRRDNFFVGDSFFRGAWITAPASTRARDGLGPVFNTSSCQSCHIKDGKGHPPAPGEDMVSMLVRISVPQSGDPGEELLRKTTGVIPHPVYGNQIQNRAIAGVPPEARPHLHWEEIEGRYADGTAYQLRKPTVLLDSFGFGEPGPGILLSARIAPAMIGVGLLDAIPLESLRSLEDEGDKNKDGISGRLNLVWDVEKEETVPGRFGWKAEQPNVRQQVAAAFQGDIGISSSLFPDQPLTANQLESVHAPDGGQPEVSDEILDFVVFYSKTLSVPAQRSHQNPFVEEGRKLFSKAKCDLCHVETFTTGLDPDFPELSHQEIHPYTDLLLHDMGEGLADGRPVFSANGREWRTPPLWGIGLVKLVNQHTHFLHDGRARSLEEAILWHGGEAEDSKEAFIQMSREDRRKLIGFLKSL